MMERMGRNKDIAKKIFFCILICLSFSIVYGQDIHPFLKIKAFGAITDFLVDDSKVILSTDAGTIETFSLKNGQKINHIRLPAMKDFMGDPVPVKVYSIDKQNDKLLIVTQGDHGFRNLLIYENGEPEEIINAQKDKMMIKKARWIDSSTILLGLLGNDLLLFDVSRKKIINKLNISPYTFSDFYLTEDKRNAFTADESGIVHKIDLIDFKIKQEYTEINVDNIYQLVYKNGVIITAGQDRRVGVYNTITGNNYFLQKSFLVYSVGLSADARIGASYATEENDISLFMTATRNEAYILKGHQSIITKIAFFDNHTLISAGDDQFLIIWKFD